ncbi:hypothetical protein GOP47_0029850 [Adiantum capillus-veneris]|nr:hypothetical protein GOP47_0029850 [Adiantum capillus-veneris]
MVKPQKWAEEDDDVGVIVELWTGAGILTMPGQSGKMREWSRGQPRLVKWWTIALKWVLSCATRWVIGALGLALDLRGRLALQVMLVPQALL